MADENEKDEIATQIDEAVEKVAEDLRSQHMLDAVVVTACWTDSEGTTHRVTRSRGNWFARLGLARHLSIAYEEELRCDTERWVRERDNDQ